VNHLKNRVDNPFNPEFRQEKPFKWREHKNKLILLIVVVAILTYGLKGFVYSNTSDIIIYDYKLNRINEVSEILPPFTDDERVYFIKNVSPYKIKIEMEIDNKNIDYHYRIDNDIINVNQTMMIWVKYNNPHNKTHIINMDIRGVGIV
jgi:hypothetical protein